MDLEVSQMLFEIKNERKFKIINKSQLTALFHIYAQLVLLGPFLCPIK